MCNPLALTSFPFYPHVTKASTTEEILLHHELPSTQRATQTPVKSLPTRGLILLGQFRKGPCFVPIQRKRSAGHPGNVQAQKSQGVVPEQAEKWVLSVKLPPPLLHSPPHSPDTVCDWC